MASEPLLNFSDLTAPIPGDNPAGSRMPLTLRQRMEAARKEFEPNPEDPAAPPIPKKPDWNGISRMAKEALTQTSKDLETSLRLTEALAKLHGFAGVRDGLHFLRDLVTECWEYLHPIPDPEDGEGMEIRAERFNWIGDSDAGARFPNTIREIPLVKVHDRPCSLKDRQLASEGRFEISGEEFNLAVPLHEEIFEEVKEALNEFQSLDAVLNEKLDNRAPGMIGLRQALEEASDYLEKLQGAPPSPEEVPSEYETDEAVSTIPSGNGQRAALGTVNINTREEAYRQISQIADILERLEPHSPIPSLLRRAVELGRLPFGRLIQELVRDPGHLSEIRREFGIREE